MCFRYFKPLDVSVENHDKLSDVFWSPDHYIFLHMRTQVYNYQQICFSILKIGKKQRRCWSPHQSMTCVFICGVLCCTLERSQWFRTPTWRRASRKEILWVPISQIQSSACSPKSKYFWLSISLQTAHLISLIQYLDQVIQCLADELSLGARSDWTSIFPNNKTWQAVLNYARLTLCLMIILQGESTAHLRPWVQYYWQAQSCGHNVTWKGTRRLTWPMYWKKVSST